MYKMIHHMAWNNLGRRYGRSLLVILMIGASLWGLLFMEGIYDGMTEQIISNTIQSDSGDLSLFARGSRLEPSLKLLLPDTLLERESLHPGPGSLIKSRSARLSHTGLLATAHAARQVKIQGVVLKQEIHHAELSGKLISGTLDFGRTRTGAILGQGLAEHLRVTVGHKVILTAQDQQQNINSLALRVTGIVRSGNQQIDEQLLYLDLGHCREFLGVAQGFSQLSLILHEQADVHLIQNQLSLELKDQSLDILRWDQLSPALLQSRQVMETFNLICNLLVFCVAGLGVWGVMTVSVLERLREFGVMLALGTSFLQIQVQVLLESILLGLGGFVLGAGPGAATLIWLAHHGLDLQIFQEGLQAFGLDTIIYAVIRTGYFTTTVIAVFLACASSVILPLHRLKQARPITILNQP